MCLQNYRIKADTRVRMRYVLVSASDPGFLATEFAAYGIRGLDTRLITIHYDPGSPTMYKLSDESQPKQ